MGICLTKLGLNAKNALSWKPITGRTGIMFTQENAYKNVSLSL